MTTSLNTKFATNQRMTTLRRNDLLYPDLSYKIIGSAFDVYNELGEGHGERYYQNALALAFQKWELRFEEQVYFPLRYHDKVVGKRFLDFLVEGKIVVEIKKRDRFSKTHIDQVLEYLALHDFKLAILINFGKECVTYKRIINFS